MKKVSLYYLLIFCSIISCDTKKHRIFYLNSYHKGYAPSDEVEDAIVAAFSSGSYELEIFHLNAKNLSEVELQKRAEFAWKAIEAYNPEILLSSDDNAMSSVIKPHLTEFSRPVLFCGINWSASKYDLPTDQVSGILEVLPVRECISYIRSKGYKADTITVLSECSIAEKKNKDILTPVFKDSGLQVKYVMVKNFNEWKEAFVNAQQDKHMLFLPTNGAIANWDHQQAVDLVLNQTSIPTFTCDAFMVAYSAFGLTKVAREQGEWIASKAKEVLRGKEITEIPISQNKRIECFVNPVISEKIDVNLTETKYNCKIFKYAK